MGHSRHLSQFRQIPIRTISGAFSLSKVEGTPYPGRTDCNSGESYMLGGARGEQPAGPEHAVALCDGPNRVFEVVEHVERCRTAECV